MLTLGCALAQNDGRYYPELLIGKFDDGQYRPDNAGSYRPDGAGGFVQRGSGGFGGQRGSIGNIKSDFFFFVKKDDLHLIKFVRRIRLW